MVETSSHPSHLELIQELIKKPENQRRIEEMRRHRAALKTREKNDRKRSELPNVSWKRARIEDKFAVAAKATEHRGGFTFNLNLSRKQMDRLRRHQDPARGFSDRINRELKKAGLPRLPYGFMLEVSKKGELHAHGFVEVSQEHLSKVKGALVAAAGKVDGGAASRQLKTDVLNDGVRWTFYCRKAVEATGEALAGSVRPFISREMIRLGREFAASFG